ncbi:MAG: glycosyltransferase [Endomicrobium sp.]|jgi:glycosyltransferase involved in cell wall biosynthesis|nr:glycosyltransferase [Endomicrobium sp.]
MKLMIAIPVYNRKKYLEITAKSLYECSNIDKSVIRVFNDCSTEFDDNYLKQLFNKSNAHIISREKNLKADGNAYQIMLDFLNTDNDVLFICDSDLLLRPDAVDYILNNFARTDGFLGLYNSELHRDIYFDGEFVYKEDAGFAGICISKNLLQKFVSKQEESSGSMDFKLSDFLIDSGVRLMVAKNCYVQHIGFCGQNCNSLSSIEFSANFMPLSDFNREIIDEILPTVLKIQANMIRHLLFEDKYRKHGFSLHQTCNYFKKKRKIKTLKKYYARKYAVKIV